MRETNQRRRAPWPVVDIATQHALVRLRDRVGPLDPPAEATMMARKHRGVRVSIALLVLALALGVGIGHQAEAKKAQWVAAWGMSPQGLASAATIVSNQTVRMIARPTATGGFVRVRLENTFATAPVT